MKELRLSLHENESVPKDFLTDQKIENLVMHNVLTFIGTINELLNFMLVAMSTQLLSGPTPGPKDVNPFLDAAMSQIASQLHNVTSSVTSSIPDTKPKRVPEQVTSKIDRGKDKEI
ncbi:hypothetical protein F3Y22_tig00004779pilonHSYRG00197 [Hibiscus syriacus]|uniref:Uncharacterized protein n=1 Tax=Hibiscus syriacus TaxID=106335 RepID=A0A6A3CG10_HIBSY|nr:hypothetical protein F3Y22_tig00004779pilonHSYRG00197 [Hibiscus syriacus]